MPGKMHLRSAGRAPTPTEPSTVNARSVRAGANKPAAKKKAKVAPRPKPTADEKRMEAATKKLISNALYQSDFEKRGNPGVFAPFRPISDREWEQDWAAMQPVPKAPPPTPNNNPTNNAAMNSSTVSAPQKKKKDKAKEPAVRTNKRKATEAPSEPARPSKRKATEPHSEAVQSKEQPTEPGQDNKTRKSARLAEKKRPRGEDSEPKEAPATKKSKSDRTMSKPSSKRPKTNNTRQRNRTTTTATASSHSASNGASATQNSANNPIVIPDHNSASNPMTIPSADGSAAPPTTALRSRSDPVTGSNGFRLLHQQHHFVRGPDQTAHLTIRFVDNTAPGVTQTHTYTSRKQGGRAPAPIDWNSAADIARLNRWMCQFLKRSGAASLRQDVVSYTPEEREWLRALGRKMADEIESGERSAAYTREEQVRLFNEVWAGTVLQEGRHAGQQRPVRTAASLESEINRSGLYPASLKKSKK